MIVQTKIQRWGNGLALRLGGVLREMPHFKEGMRVNVEVTGEGITVKKCVLDSDLLFPYTEAELLNGLTSEMAHADLLANPLSHEIGQ
jgi:antitoxin MazE